MNKQPIHPGEQIALDLADIGFSQSQLANALGIPRSRISDIVRGKSGITADTALRLSRWQRTTPEYWMTLQSNYDLDRAREVNGEEINAKVRPYADRRR